MYLGLGLGLRSAVGLNFSALTALPSARQSAVTTAANTAAATLDVTPQSIIDALSVGRGLASLLPNDGCLLASSGGAVTVQGDPVGAIRSWTGVEVATQSNASLRPTSGADGIIADGIRRMDLGDLSAWTQAEAFSVTQRSQDVGSTYWRIGTAGLNDHYPWDDSIVYSGFASNTRIQGSVPFPNFTKKIVFNSIHNGSNLTVIGDGVTRINSNVTISLSSSASFLEGFAASGFLGTWSALSLNSATYSTAQRAAVQAFCKEYFGVTY